MWRRSGFWIRACCAARTAGGHCVHSLKLASWSTQAHTAHAGILAKEVLASWSKQASTHMKCVWRYMDACASNKTAPNGAFVRVHVHYLCTHLLAFVAVFLLPHHRPGKRPAFFGLHPRQQQLHSTPHQNGTLNESGKQDEKNKGNLQQAGTAGVRKLFTETFFLSGYPSSLGY